MLSAVCLKALALVHTVLCLLLVQTFFIDWERPRFLGTDHFVAKPIEDEPANAGNIRDGKKRGDAKTVVIW